MEEKEKILRLILGLDFDKERKSTLQLALKQAHRLTGIRTERGASRASWLFRGSENADTPEEMADMALDKYEDESMDILTSLCLYLIVLDQLGHIFGDRSYYDNRTRAAIIKSHLDDKYNLNEADLESISELRNSINHNFGLVSCKKNSSLGKEKYIICFNDDGNNKPISRNLSWDGDWHDKSEDTSTHVFPFSLMNFVEEVLHKIIELYQRGSVDSPLSVEELKMRFTIIDR